MDALPRCVPGLGNPQGTDPDPLWSADLPTGTEGTGALDIFPAVRTFQKTAE